MVVNETATGARRAHRQLLISIVAVAAILVTAVSCSSDSSSSSTETTGSGSGSGSGAAVQAANPTAGIDANTIRIGLHAPISGPSGFPAESFSKGANLYWDWIAQNGQTVAGRKVELVIRDDAANPAKATEACKELSETTLLVIGMFGSDQIKACAQYLNDQRVPYFSTGITQQGLEGLPFYFTVTATYPQIDPLIIDWMTEKMDASSKKLALLILDSRNLDDSHDRLVAGAKEAGIEVVYDQRVPLQPTPAQTAQIATELEQAGADIVFTNIYPQAQIGILTTATAQEYFPKWTQINGFNSALEGACKATGGRWDATAFSPTPGLDYADKEQPEFKQMANEKGTAGTDQELNIWAISSIINGILDLPGNDLNRDSLLQALQGARVTTTLMPPVAYTASDHFGAEGIDILASDCQRGQFKTIETSFDGG